MGADAAKLPPFRKLPFKAPDMDVRRGEGGVVYLSSRTPLGPVPRSIPHVLDERAAEHPDRPWLKQRAEPNHGAMAHGDVWRGREGSRGRWRRRCWIAG